MSARFFLADDSSKFLPRLFSTSTSFHAVALIIALNLFMMFSHVFNGIREIE